MHANILWFQEIITNSVVGFIRQCKIKKIAINIQVRYKSDLYKINENIYYNKKVQINKESIKCNLIYQIRRFSRIFLNF